MPDYKHRKIKLAPERRANGLWRCPYMIIEFTPTCWAYRKGCPEGSFLSRQEAATAALEEAKRLVDSLEPPPRVPLAGLGMGLATYGNRMRSLIFEFVQGLFCLWTRAPRRVWSFLNGRRIVTTTPVTPGERR